MQNNTRQDNTEVQNDTNNQQFPSNPTCTKPHVGGSFLSCV